MAWSVGIEVCANVGFVDVDQTVATSDGHQCLDPAYKGMVTAFPVVEEVVDQDGQGDTSIGIAEGQQGVPHRAGESSPRVATSVLSLQVLVAITRSPSRMMALQRVPDLRSSLT